MTVAPAETSDLLHQLRQRAAVRHFVGIDPGITGGLACVDNDGELIAVTPMPVLTSGGKNVIDAHGVSDWLELVTPLRHVIIEAQQVRPVEGRSSIFKTGYGYGILIGVLSTMGIPFTSLTPGVWKQRARCPRDKEAALLTARRRWPDEDAFRLKKNHGLAEAALMAKLAKDSA